MRNWYQNIQINDKQVFEDSKRADSKFWGEGKWKNFIEPLLPERRETFIELGCNAGLFLKLAKDAGFKRVIGVENHPDSITQAEVFKKQNGYDYKIINQIVDENIEIPIADVVLLSNFHYYLSIPTLAELAHRLRTKTSYVIVVSAKAKPRRGNAHPDLNAIRGYFKDYEEIKTIQNLNMDDPAPRRNMFGTLLKADLITINVKNTLRRYLNENELSDREKVFDTPETVIDLYKRVFKNQKFNIKDLKLFKYWKKYSRMSDEQIVKMIEGKIELGKDIQKNGFKVPVYYRRKEIMLDGFHRLVIARLLNYKEILCRIL